MEKKQKLSSEELNELKELSEKYNKIISEIGVIVIQENEISKNLQDIITKKEYLLSDNSKLIEKEKELGTKLTEKYGAGKIDLNSGEIVSI